MFLVKVSTLRGVFNDFIRKCQLYDVFLKVGLQKHCKIRSGNLAQPRATACVNHGFLHMDIRTLYARRIFGEIMVRFDVLLFCAKSGFESTFEIIFGRVPQKWHQVAPGGTKMPTFDTNVLKLRSWQHLNRLDE